MAVAKWSESLNDGQRLMLPLIQISDVLGLIQILSSNKGSIINCFTILYNHGGSARVCVLLQGTTREKKLEGNPRKPMATCKYLAASKQGSLRLETLFL